MIILDIDPSTASRAIHRSLLPGRYCGEALSAEGIELKQSPGIPRGVFPDAYIVHGFIDRSVLYYLDAVQQLGGRRVVWELDDNLWQLPGTGRLVERARMARSVIDTLRGMADLIIVSTQELARFLNWPEKTIVCPNLVERNWFLARDERPATPVKIVWSGSWVHQQDIESITPAIVQLLQEEDGGVEVSILGGERLPRALRSCSHVTHHRWQEVGKYRENLANLSPDIWLAPVLDHPYNRAKTNVKWLEATCSGAAFVGSDIEPYRCVRHDETGLLVSDGDWYGAMRGLVFDVAKRHALVRNARERVSKSYAWDQVEARRPWLDAFRRAAGIDVLQSS